MNAYFIKDSKGEREERKKERKKKGGVGGGVWVGGGGRKHYHKQSEGLGRVLWVYKICLK